MALLTDLGEEFVLKTALSGVQVSVGLYNSSDAIADTDDLAQITTEPTGGNYTRQTANLSLADVSGNWTVRIESQVSFDTTGTTGTVDSYFLVANFTAEDTGDGGDTDHLIAVGSLSSIDLAHVDTLNIPANGIALSVSSYILIIENASETAISTTTLTATDTVVESTTEETATVTSTQGSILAGDDYSPQDANMVLVVDPGQNQDIYTNFQNALDASNDGDTVLLPQGSYILNQDAFMHCGSHPNVHIRGHGSDANGTILYKTQENTDYLLTLTGGGTGQSPPSPFPQVEVSHILFQAIETRLHSGDTGSEYMDFRGMSLGNIDFYVHNCKFQYFSARAVDVSHPQDFARGVIADCTFTKCLAYSDSGAPTPEGWSRGYAFNIVVYGSDPNAWPSADFGTQDYVFIEDCHFSFLRPVIASGHCSRWVFRRNYCEKNPNDTAFLETHAATPSWDTGRYPGRIMEVYENVFVNTPQAGEEDDWLRVAADDWGVFSPKGGEWVFHNNICVGYSDEIVNIGIGDDFYDEAAAPSDYDCTYPTLYQTGYQSGVDYGASHTGTDPSTYGNGDGFIWNNTHGGASIIWKESPVTWEGSPVHLLNEDRDYHFTNPSGYTKYTYPHPRRS